MAETATSTIAPASPTASETPAEERTKAPEPAVSSPATEAETPPASHTQSVLRDAIQKVMQEIALHEKEAKRHLQQAQELRKDLRETFAYFQDPDRRAKANPVSDEKRSEAPAATEKQDATIRVPLAEKRKSRRALRKRSRGKAKEG